MNRVTGAAASVVGVSVLWVGVMHDAPGVFEVILYCILMGE